MRGVFLVVGAALAVGLLAVADDGSVGWPSGDDGSVVWPSPPGEAGPQQIDVISCAFWCTLEGCTMYPGTLLTCTCSGGRVCCSYWRCLQNPWWMFWKPCGCGTEVECYAIPCTPGEPIPTSLPQSRLLE